jgi:hypothetical protein
MLVALLLASAAPPGLPKIDVTPNQGGYRAKVADFDGTLLDRVDSEIARRAAELCAGKSIRWGEFRSQTALGRQPGAKPPRISGYVRGFSCTQPKQRVYEPAPADWKPSAADLADVQQIFKTYYARRDGGDFSSAFKLFAPGVIGNADSWAAEMRHFNKQIRHGKRRITAISWELNPEAAAHPGVYVAIDFIGNFPTTHFYCGYLGLYRRGPGAYEIVHEEQNQFARGDGTADLAQVAQMRAAMCRGE